MFPERFIFDRQYSKRKDPPNRKQANGKSRSRRGSGIGSLCNRESSPGLSGKPTSPYFSPMLSMMVSTRPSMLFSVVRYGAMRSV